TRDPFDVAGQQQQIAPGQQVPRILAVSQAEDMAAETLLRDRCFNFAAKWTVPTKYQPRVGMAITDELEALQQSRVVLFLGEAAQVEQQHVIPAAAKQLNEPLASAFAIDDRGQFDPTANRLDSRYRVVENL